MRSLADIEAELSALRRPAFDWSPHRLEASRVAIETWTLEHPELAARHAELAAEREVADASALESYRAQRARPQLPTLTSTAAGEARETDAMRGVRGWLGGRALWCLVVGPVGTGKSVAARWAVDQVLETGRRALMTTAVRVSRLSTWDDAGELDRLERAELLVVDDVGAEVQTDHSRVSLRALLDVRHDSTRRTLLTSNLAGGGLSRWLGERITDRILSSYVRVETSGASVRTHHPQGGTP